MVCSSCDGVRMGQGGSAGGEGGEEVQGELEKVKEDLSAALAELDKKEEQVNKLSGIRDQVEAKLQDVTKTNKEEQVEAKLQDVTKTKKEELL